MGKLTHINYNIFSSSFLHDLFKSMCVDTVYSSWLRIFLAVIKLIIILCCGMISDEDHVKLKQNPAGSSYACPMCLLFSSEVYLHYAEEAIRFQKYSNELV